MVLSVHERIGRKIKGQPGSRWQIPTPALVIDLDVFERNLAKMAAHCAANGIGLRPHAKTHKSAEIAKRQMAAGAVGICCAKLAEAEALAARGVENILLTSPLATSGSIARAVELNDVIEELILVVDHPDGAAALDEAGKAAGKSFRVLIDIDPGLHRTGITLGQSFDALAEQIKGSEGLTFLGIQGYAGHLMHEHDAEKRKADSLAVMENLRETKARLNTLNLTCSITTGGGTGTYDIDPEAGVLTDLQGGSYIFMDRQYAEVWGEEPPVFEPALFVQMTVISVNTPGIVTTDAGFKSFATDADAPLIHQGAPKGAAYFFFGDEQGGIAFADAERDSLPLGAQISCVVPHCDPTVNLYDWYHVVQGDVLVDLWPVDARGCAQ